MCVYMYMYVMCVVCVCVCVCVCVPLHRYELHEWIYTLHTAIEDFKQRKVTAKEQKSSSLSSSSREQQQRQPHRSRQRAATVSGSTCCSTSASSASCHTPVRPPPPPPAPYTGSFRKPKRHAPPVPVKDAGSSSNRNSKISSSSSDAATQRCSLTENETAPTENEALMTETGHQARDRAQARVQRDSETAVNDTSSPTGDVFGNNRSTGGGGSSEPSGTGVVGGAASNMRHKTSQQQQQGEQSPQVLDLNIVSQEEEEGEEEGEGDGESCAQSSSGGVNSPTSPPPSDPPRAPRDKVTLERRCSISLPELLSIKKSPGREEGEGGKGKKEERVHSSEDVPKRCPPAAKASNEEEEKEELVVRHTRHFSLIDHHMSGQKQPSKKKISSKRQGSLRRRSIKHGGSLKRSRSPPTLPPPPPPPPPHCDVPELGPEPKVLPADATTVTTTTATDPNALLIKPQATPHTNELTSQASATSIGFSDVLHTISDIDHQLDELADELGDPEPPGLSSDLHYLHSLTTPTQEQGAMSPTEQAVSPTTELVTSPAEQVVSPSRSIEEQFESLMSNCSGDGNPLSFYSSLPGSSASPPISNSLENVLQELEKSGSTTPDGGAGTEGGVARGRGVWLPPPIDTRTPEDQEIIDRNTSPRKRVEKPVPSRIFFPDFDSPGRKRKQQQQQQQQVVVESIDLPMASYGFPKVDNTEQVVANKQKKVVMFKEEVEQLPLHVEDDGGLEHYNEEEEEEEEEEGEEGEDGLGDEREQQPLRGTGSKVGGGIDKYEVAEGARSNSSTSGGSSQRSVAELKKMLFGGKEESVSHCKRVVLSTSNVWNTTPHSAAATAPLSDNGKKSATEEQSKLQQQQHLEKQAWSAAHIEEENPYESPWDQRPVSKFRQSFSPSITRKSKTNSVDFQVVEVSTHNAPVPKNTELRNVHSLERSRKHHSVQEMSSSLLESISHTLQEQSKYGSDSLLNDIVAATGESATTGGIVPSSSLASEGRGRGRGMTGVAVARGSRWEERGENRFGSLGRETRQASANNSNAASVSTSGGGRSPREELAKIRADYRTAPALPTANANPTTTASTSFVTRFTPPMSRRLTQQQQKTSPVKVSPANASSLAKVSTAKVDTAPLLLNGSYSHQQQKGSPPESSRVRFSPNVGAQVTPPMSRRPVVQQQPSLAKFDIPQPPAAPAVSVAPLNVNNTSSSSSSMQNGTNHMRKISPAPIAVSTAPRETQITFDTNTQSHVYRSLV